MTNKSTSSDSAGNAPAQIGAELAKVLVYSIQSGDEAPAVSALTDQKTAIESALLVRNVRELGPGATDDDISKARENVAARASHWLELETQRLRERIARQKARDEIRQDEKMAKDTNRGPAQRPARSQKAGKPPDPPGDDETLVVIAQARNRLHGALERAAHALSESEDDLVREDPRHQLVSNAPVNETVVIAVTSITSTTQGEGTSRVTTVPWGSIRKLWALRPALVRIELQSWPKKQNREVRDDFLKHIDGIAAATFVAPDSGELKEQDALVKEWLRAKGVLILSPDQFAALQGQCSASGAIAYVRGGILYLGALTRRLTGVGYALERVGKSHDYADADIQANKPLDHEAIFASIEKHCDEGLHAALDDAHRELATNVDLLHVRLESWVHSHPNLLRKTEESVRRSGSTVSSAFELYEVDPHVVDAIVSTIKGTDGDPKSVLPAIDHPPMVDTCSTVGDQIVRFCESRLRDRIVWEMLCPTRLVGQVDKEPWTSIKAENFFEPISQRTTKALINTRLERLKSAAAEFIPEFEVPRQVGLLAAFLRSPDAYKIMMQRFAGVFMMALVIGGVSVPALIKAYFQSVEGWPLLIWSVVCFLVLFTGLAFLILRSARAEALAIAQVKARESLLKLQRKALDDITMEWSKALDRNSTEGLNDLMRRLRSDLESPAARQRKDWQARAEGLKQKRAALESRNEQLEQCRKYLDDTTKALRQAGAKLTAKMFKAAGLVS